MFPPGLGWWCKLCYVVSLTGALAEGPSTRPNPGGRATNGLCVLFRPVHCSEQILNLESFNNIETRASALRTARERESMKHTQPSSCVCVWGHPKTRANTNGFWPLLFVLRFGFHLSETDIQQSVSALLFMIALTAIKCDYYAK